MGREGSALHLRLTEEGVRGLIRHAGKDPEPDDSVLLPAQADDGLTGSADPPFRRKHELESQVAVEERAAPYRTALRQRFPDLHRTDHRRVAPSDRSVRRSGSCVGPTRMAVSMLPGGEIVQ